MSLYLGDTPICGGIEGNQLNNPFSLLDYKYSEYELSNASWLLSNGQWNSGAVYQSVYNLLLQIYNGTVTKAGVSVKLSTETYTDTDFVLNTTDTTFRLPIKVLMAGSKRVAGNGMTLGLTNDSQNAGLIPLNNGSYWALSTRTGNYGTNIGTGQNGSSLANISSVGITTDPTKSGIETSANGLYLYFYVGETVQDANIIAAGQVLTDIADLKNASNFSSLGKETVVGWEMPDYSAPVSVSFPFTAPSDGVVVGIFGVSSGRGSIYINGKKVGYSPVTGDDNGFFIVMNKGLQLTATSSNSNPVQTAGLFFYPCKGVN